MVGELAVDARQVALSKEQCFFLLEGSGELIGVAGQVGFFAGEAILCRLELGIECVKDVIEPLEEPDAVGRYLGHLERAGSRVLQRIASLRAAQAQTDCAAGRWPHRNLEIADRRRSAWMGRSRLPGRRRLTCRRRRRGRPRTRGPPPRGRCGHAPSTTKL